MIPTSHVGTLPRPEELDALCTRYELPRDDGRFTSIVPGMVADVVRRQAELGLTIVNDGEFGKRGGFSYYAQTRLAGVESRGVEHTPAARDITARDARDFPGYYRARRSGINRPMFCIAPLKYAGHNDLQFDIDNLRRAVEGLDVRPFLSAVAPGTIEHWLWNEHYESDEACLFAVADAMHEEYKAITGAGILLQIDDPDLPDGWQMYPDMTVDDYRVYARQRVEALNHALRGIPEEMVRLHVCWGSGHGPHSNDIPLRDIVDLVLQVRAGCYRVEAANPRHEHEWEVWRDVRLPDGKTLMPGVVGHASDVVEHPELVAQRIVRFANLVGRGNVIAGTDCGLGGRVAHPEIAWAKLRALRDGARLATRALWG
ncbi:MAG TPA: cobalamin-independent methionine synthase II family protein [Vicinamibacterales bacterium]|nr:cobalamin-independent methionine synthase II family protein [Vicinamibacterales bacterium]